MLRPLVQSGQIQVANHTYSLADLTTLDAEGVKEELQRNEDEIMSMFGCLLYTSMFSEPRLQEMSLPTVS